MAVRAKAGLRRAAQSALLRLRGVAVREAVAEAERSFAVERAGLLRRVRLAEQRAATAATESAEQRRTLKEQAALITDGQVEPSPARRSGDQPPSFRYKLGEQRRLALAIERDHGVLEPVFAIDAKLDGREFARRLGINVAALLAGPTPMSELRFDSLPERFVVKPLDSHSGRGVSALVRTDDGRYMALMDSREIVDEDELKRRYEVLRRDGAVSDKVLIEQLLCDDGPDGPQMPVDWRMFCFAGEVGLVQGRFSGGRRSLRFHGCRFFDDAWNDLGITRLDVRTDPTIEVPRHADELVRVARRISTAIPRAMLRIDLYSVEEGVFFGEVTPTPGGDWLLTPQADKRLGAYWERGEARLLADVIRSGTRSPKT